MIVGIVGIGLAVCFGIALLGFTRGWFGEKSGIRKDNDRYASRRLRA